MDVELWIRSAEGRYSAELVGREAQGPVVLARDVLDKLSPVDLRAHLGPYAEPYGHLLTSAVFTNPLREGWAQVVGRASNSPELIRLVLVLQEEDDELHAMRWELLHDPLSEGGYLALGWTCHRLQA